jgi:hypothetical protein
MLYKCANESCNAPFRRLREGKLFNVETEYFAGRSPSILRKTIPTRRIEHYRLCDACSPFVTLTFDQGRGVITVPLPEGAGKKTVKMLSLDSAEMQLTEDSHQTLIEVMK